MKRVSKSHRPRSHQLNLETLENRTLLSTFMVDRLTDSGQGSDLAGDLRYCITQATDGDSIQCDVQGIINLTKLLPDVAHSIRIEGPGQDLLTVTGAHQYQIFTVDKGATVEISSLTIANGDDVMSRASGILNDGTLTIDSCTLSGNRADDGSGGAIFNTGTLTVRNCTFSGNYADSWGGAIYSSGRLATLTVSNSSFSGNLGHAGSAITSDGGSLEISSSTFSDNRSGFGTGGTLLVLAGTGRISTCDISGNNLVSFGDGGIVNHGTLTLNDSIVSGNLGGGEGTGGIDNTGTMTITDSTLTGNSSGSPEFAGAIRNSGTLTVQGSTISGNRGGSLNSAGAIANYAYANNDAIATLLNCTIANNTDTANPNASQLLSAHAGTGTGQARVVLRNTIVSGDASLHNVFAQTGGTFVSQGHNLSSDDGSGFLTGPGDLLNTDPKLGPLQDNGGPTQTMALLPGSPAVDAGDNTGAPDFDQRGPGFARIVGGTIDIGAFEAQIGPATHLAVSTVTEVTSGSPFDVTVTALDAYGHIAAGYLGTVTFSSTDTDPAVMLPADYTFTADDQGVHTFAASVTFITAGSQTLTATDTADNTITGSATVTIDPGAVAPRGGLPSQPVNATLPTASALIQLESVERFF